MKKLFILIALLIPFVTFAGPEKTRELTFNWSLTVTDDKGKVTTLKVDPKGRDSFFLPSEWVCSYTEISNSKKGNIYIETSYLMCLREESAVMVLAGCGMDKKAGDYHTQSATVNLLVIDKKKQDAHKVSVELGCKPK